MGAANRNLPEFWLKKGSPMRNWTIATTLLMALWAIVPVSAHAEEKAAEATEEAASEEKGGTEAESKEADKTSP